MPLVDLADPFTAQFHAAYASWFRLEPRSRTEDLQVGIEVRTADPLWMLARQWQMGEFQAADAGSPIDAEVTFSTYGIDELTPYGASSTEPVAGLPLETMVEREPEQLDYRLRVQIGQQFERQLRTHLAADDDSGRAVALVLAFYREKLGLELPSSPELALLDERTARFVRFMAGRVVDGERLLAARRLPMPGGRRVQRLRAEIEAAFDAVREWRRHVLSEPDPEQPAAWQHPELHYGFSVGARSSARSRSQVKLVAWDYRNGELDWHTFALAGSLPTPRSGTQTFHTLPTRLDIAAQSPRWWAFADKQLNLARLEPQIADLAKALYTDFVTDYSDDWFRVPLPVGIGQLVRVDQVTVTDVFGQQSKIASSRVDGTSPLDRWEMFTLAEAGAPEAPGVPGVLLVPPLAGHRLESPPLEEVRFVRDEGANMVWAVERTVRDGVGAPVDGFEAQRALSVRAVEHAIAMLRVALEDARADNDSEDENRPDREKRAAEAEEYAKQIAALEALLSTQTSSTGVPRYRLSTKVPENWVPFQPYSAGGLFARRPGSLVLARSRMWCDLDAAEAQDIDGMTSLLALTGNGDLLWLSEETVPRSGVRVLLTKQRIRWVDGETYVWLGRKAVAGRGEGSSGLRFDVVKED